MNRLTFPLLLLGIVMTLTSCLVIKTTYKTIKGSVKDTAWVVRGTYRLTKETTRLACHLSKFTF